MQREVEKLPEATAVIVEVPLVEAVPVTNVLSLNNLNEFANELEEDEYN